MPCKNVIESVILLMLKKYTVSLWKHVHISCIIAVVADTYTWWPRHRENREFGCYFFQTGKTHVIFCNTWKPFWNIGKFFWLHLSVKKHASFHIFWKFLVSLCSAQTSDLQIIPIFSIFASVFTFKCAHASYLLQMSANLIKKVFKLKKAK